MNDARCRHERRSRAQWEQLIGRQRGSGQSQQAFCHANGIALSTFQYWKRRLGESTVVPDDGAADWVDVSRVLPAGVPNGWEIELDLGGGVCLRLRRG